MQQQLHILKQEEYINKVLAGLKKIFLTGYTNEIVTISPKGYKNVSNFTLQKNGLFFELLSLNHKIFGAMDFTGGLHFEPITFFYGLPERCPVCGKESTRYVIYKAYRQSSRATKGLTVDLQNSILDSAEKSEFWEDLKNERYFLLIPFCDEHDSLDVFFEAILTPMNGRNVFIKRFYINDFKFANQLWEDLFQTGPVQMIRGVRAKPDSEENIIKLTQVIKKIQTQRNILCSSASVISFTTVFALLKLSPLYNLIAGLAVSGIIALIIYLGYDKQIKKEVDAAAKRR